MNARAGVVVSQWAWMASLPVTAAAPTFDSSVRGAVAGFLAAALASFLPDIDHHNSTAGRYMPGWVRAAMGGHRMLTHSLLAIAGSWWLTGYLLENPIVANAIAVGWSAHVVIDMLTKQGVGLLYPLTRRKIRIGWFTTGSKGEDRFIVGVHVVGALILAYYGYLLIGGT